jgi:copper resistance protein B
VSRACVQAAVALLVVLVTAPPLQAQSSTSPCCGAPAHDAGHGQDQGRPTSKPVEPLPQSTADLPPFIPRLTDDDRKAAFPDVRGHAVHDRSLHYFALFDQLEWQASDEAVGLNADAKGWLGRDRDRLWFRAEGNGEEGRVDDAQAHFLYGRQFSRWWDVVGGIRQDFQPGPARTWAAIGVQGLSPYRFEIEATAYVGASGRTQARFEVEYELLITNRLVLQPQLEAEVFGKSDPARGVGAGLGTTDVGFRLRYELRRELAPYVGVTWQRKYGKTADLARESDESVARARFVAGLRVWF